MRDLFVLNERATFFGEWAHGFMSYCAVGATNVGSIIFHYDPEMVTNINSGRILYGAHADKDFTLIDPRLPDGLPVEKGNFLRFLASATRLERTGALTAFSDIR